MNFLNPDELEDQELAAQRKRDYLNVAGSVLQKFADIPSSYEMIYGKSSAKPDVKGAMASAAGMIKSPTDIQNRRFDQTKKISDFEVQQNEISQRTANQDPNSNISKAKKLMAQKYGFALGPEASGYDVDQLLDTKKMNEVEAQSQVNFNNQKQLREMDEKADLKKIYAQQAFDMKKIAAQKAMDQHKRNLSGDNLPFEVKDQVGEIAKSSGKMQTIRNMIGSSLKQLEDPKMSEEQKIQVGNELLKVLNSPLGSDAIGTEEANRLGGMLQFQLFNVTKPGAFVGRDLKGFTEGVRNNAKRLDDTLKTNRGQIDSLKQGRPLRNEIKRQKNKQTGQIRVVYDDGSVELLSTAVAGG